MAAKGLVVKARKDESTLWAHGGGYLLQRDAYQGRPCYKKDTTGAGGGDFFIFYHPALDNWLIGERLVHGRSVEFNVRSKSAGDSPEHATWPEDKVQAIFAKDPSSGGARDAKYQVCCCCPSSFRCRLFVDKEFPHRTDPSIIRPGGTQIRLPCEKPQWIPGRLLREGEWQLFDGIDPRNLLQGKLGDCWLIAAMACMAEFPDEVQSLFQRDGLRNGDGRYKVRLFDHKLKDFTDVTVDEYIPCMPNHWWDDEAEPCFAKASGNQIWCLILEKAMAKMVGSYGDLSGGSTAAAFRALTGEQEQANWEFDLGRRSWLKSTLKEDSLNLFTYPRGHQESKGEEEFFDHLNQCDAQNFLLSASISKRGRGQRERPDGLVEGHAYSVIHLIKVTTSSGQKFRLVQMRNPWGDKEWNGEWSDGHRIWDQYKEVKQALRPVFGGDGAFWMEWRGFCAAFTDVVVCHKAMRQGEHAADHSAASVDWRKFRHRVPGPPPTHSIHLGPPVASLRPGAPAADTGCGCWRWLCPPKKPPAVKIRVRTGADGALKTH